MYTGNISVRYARALFAFAQKMGEEKKVFEEVDVLLNHLNSVAKLPDSLSNPVIPSSQKEQLLLSASGFGVSHSLSRFIKLMLLHKREDLIKLICLQYIDMYRKQNNILRVTVTSAGPMDEDIRQRIYDLIDNNTDSTLDLRHRVDPKLIGGFVLNADGYRLDASIVSQLNSIKKQLEGDTYSAGE